jgi:hypothetical protein
MRSRRREDRRLLALSHYFHLKFQQLFNQRPSFPSLVCRQSKLQSSTEQLVSDQRRSSEKMKALIRQKEAGKINLGRRALKRGESARANAKGKSDRKMKICNYGDEGVDAEASNCGDDDARQKSAEGRLE